MDARIAGTEAPGGGRSRRRAWILAARVPTLPAGVSPVIVGTGAAAGAGMFHPAAAFAAFIVATGLQIGTNLHNDALDFLHGADSASRLGPTRVSQSGLLSTREVLRGAYACFGAAALAGLYLAALRGWAVLLAGLLAMGSAVAYTANPWRLGYRGLGDVFVFVFFGLVAVTGTDYVQTGAIRPVALAASIPVGLLIVAILTLNNLRDIETDRAAGKRTLAVQIGAPATRIQYVCCLAAGVAAPAVMRAAGLAGVLFWLPWLAVPWMVILARTVLVRGPALALNHALRLTAGVLLLYSVLFALVLAGGQP